MNLPFESHQKNAAASKYSAAILLSLTILLGAFLRFHTLGENGYWYDEVIMVHVAQQDLSVLIDDFPGGRPPLYVVFAHFWVQTFGTNEQATRSLSAILGVISIGLLYIVGRELFDRRVAIISALFMAISEFQIWYSQDFRYYPLMVMLTLLSFLFYVRALKNGKRMDWALYVVASILLFYTHYLGILLIAAQGLYFAVRWVRTRSDLVPWLLSQMAIAVGVGPSIVSYLPRTVAGTVEPMKETLAPTLSDPLVTAAKFLLSGRYDLSGAVMSLIIISGLIYLIASVGIFARNQGQQEWLRSVSQLRSYVPARIRQERERLILLLCWLVCPLILLYLISVVFGPVYRHKYVIGAAPALYLLVAFGITTIRRAVPEVAILGLIVILTLPGLQRYYATDAHEQWREVSSYVQENGRANDVIIFPIFDRLEQPTGFPQPSLHLTFDWYYQGELPTCDANLQFVRQDAQVFATLTACLAAHGNGWLIMYDTPEPFHDLLRQPGALQDASGARSITLVDRAEFTEISVYRVRLEDQSARQVGQ
jgi:mannosyltransferase